MLALSTLSRAYPFEYTHHFLTRCRWSVVQSVDNNETKGKSVEEGQIADEDEVVCWVIFSSLILNYFIHIEKFGL